MLNLRLRGPINHRFLRPTVLYLVLLLASCSGNDAAVEEHTFRVETGEDGVPTAITSLVPKYEGLLLRYEEVVRLHQDEERPESLLHQAYQYERGPDGNYYVMDRGNNRVAVFGPDGEYLRSFGRAGDGPGEFRSPRLQSVDERGVIVYDARSRRVNLFDLDGRLLDSYSNPKATGSVSEISLEGDFLVAQGYQYENLPDRSRHTWYVMTVMTTSGDTIGSVTSGVNYMPAPIQIEGGPMFQMMEHYGSRAMLLNSPGKGILSYDGATPGFCMYDFRGRLQKRFRLEMTTRPVTREDREAVYAFYRRQLEEGADETTRMLDKTALEYASFADQMPYYQSVGMDRSGYFWILPLLDRTQFDPQAPVRYLLLSPEGEYLGDVECPPGIVSQPGPLIYTRSENPETGDYDYIIYRMVPALPGFTYP